MRVAMMGYQTWGHRTLQALIESHHQVVFVVTHPPSTHVYEQIWNDSVADLAERAGVPVMLRSRPDDEALVANLEAAEPGCTPVSADCDTARNSTLQPARIFLRPATSERVNRVGRLLPELEYIS